MTTHPPPPAYTYGRWLFWFVMALIAVSIGYSLWHVVVNWTFITV